MRRSSKPQGGVRQRHVTWSVAGPWLCLLLSFCCYPSPVGAEQVSISPVFSSIVAPSPVAPSPTSHPPPPPHTPTPSPIPSNTPFLKYVKNDTLYLQIEQMTFNIYADSDSGYHNLTVDQYPALWAQPSWASVNSTTDQLDFVKEVYYNRTRESGSVFSLSFSLKLEPPSPDQMWYISSFTHSNLTQHTLTSNNNSCIFHYSGVNVVHAPPDLGYFCGNLTFRGDCVDNIKSEVNFVGLYIQAFGLNKGTPSTKYVDCGAKNHNNSIIDIVVGSVVGATLGVALLVIVATLLIKAIRKKMRWRQYNLLDN